MLFNKRILIPNKTTNLWFTVLRTAVRVMWRGVTFVSQEKAVMKCTQGSVGKHNNGGISVFLTKHTRICDGQNEQCMCNVFFQR